MGSTVEQDRSHLAEQVEHAVERVKFADKARSKSSTRQVGRNGGLHTPLMKKVKSFKSSLTSIRIIGTINWQQLRDCQYSTMERTNSWRMMCTALWTKRLISRQPF